jgi:hypothetical protein
VIRRRCPAEVRNVIEDEADNVLDRSCRASSRGEPHSSVENNDPRAQLEWRDQQRRLPQLVMTPMRSQCQDKAAWLEQRATCKHAEILELNQDKSLLENTIDNLRAFEQSTALS